MALNTTLRKSILGASYNFSANKSLSESKHIESFLKM